MTGKENVIDGLECCNGEALCIGEKCPYFDDKMCVETLHSDALALLKAQEQATAEPKRIDLADETKARLDKMDAVDALGNIADICIDWDGYRTADGLGGLINEIWAYARYCADRLEKAQEPRVMTLDEALAADYVYLEIRLHASLPCECCILAVDPDSGILPLRKGFCAYLDGEEYGETWRCWTSRPTDEQREAESWQ